MSVTQQQCSCEPAGGSICCRKSALCSCWRTLQLVVQIYSVHSCGSDIFSWLQLDERDESSLNSELPFL